MSLFDGPRKSAFTTLTNVMGETLPGVWTPSAGGSPYTHKVLLREPTETEKIEGMEFTPLTFMIEWQEPHFPGLFEAVFKQQTEFMFIGAAKYFLRRVEAIVDGKGYKVIAEKLTT